MRLHRGERAEVQQERSSMIERDVEKLLVRAVEAVGGIAYKFISPGHSGVPDRLVVLPGGEMFFVELKAPGKHERPLQVQEQERLRALGCKVFSSVDSPERVEEVARYTRRVCGYGV